MRGQGRHSAWSCRAAGWRVRPPLAASRVSETGLWWMAGQHSELLKGKPTRARASPACCPPCAHPRQTGRPALAPREGSISRGTLVTKAKSQIAPKPAGFVSAGTGSAHAPWKAEHVTVMSPAPGRGHRGQPKPQWHQQQPKLSREDLDKCLEEFPAARALLQQFR